MCSATSARNPANASCNLRLSMRCERRAPQLAKNMLTALMPMTIRANRDGAARAEAVRQAARAVRKFFGSGVQDLKAANG